MVEYLLAMERVAGSSPVFRTHAAVAQLAEHLLPKQRVVGSEGATITHRTASGTMLQRRSLARQPHCASPTRLVAGRAAIPRKSYEL